jgi:hypothetical protein
MTANTHSMLHAAMSNAWVIDSNVEHDDTVAQVLGMFDIVQGLSASKRCLLVK